MSSQLPLGDECLATGKDREMLAEDEVHQIAPDLAYKPAGISNVVFFGERGAGDRGWVLIDAGVSEAQDLIIRAAQARFGEDARPGAIVLTHGHFDHVGALANLAEQWDAPIYAHLLEFPYLTGLSEYPPADPTVGGGLISEMSPTFPRGPIDVKARLQELPRDGSVPQMRGWRWMHTPGHAPGHVSLFRDTDRALIAGDAFITTRQESAYAVAAQKPEMHGPPQYLTPDWFSAHTSVRQLADLEPELAVTGHGPAVRGEEMRVALHQLGEQFQQIAVPKQGRYVATSPQS